MTDAMSKALDELMGKHRNVTDVDAQKVKMKIDDEEVCKFALAGLCPYTLFNNTKSDLGSCGYDVHAGHREWDRLQSEYNDLSEADKDERGYERNLYDVLARLTQKLDMTIARNKEVVEKDNQPRPIKAVDQARLDALKQQEQDAIEQSEALAEAGDADGMVAMTEKAAKYKEEHDTLRLELVTPERIKAVCEVCGVFTNSNDNEQRKEDHLNGKQYLGWKAIRAKLKELEEKYKSMPRTTRDVSRPHEQRSRDVQPERDYRGRDDREREHRVRDGGSDYRDRRHDRYGDRGNDRYGDRGGDRYGGSRGGDRTADRRGYGGGRDRDRDGYGHGDRYGSRGGSRGDYGR